jgi:DNA-binding transcriptional regulator YiaG
MTPDTFTQLAKELGMTNADVALITGNTIRAVQYWATGKNPVPQSAYLLLKAMADGKLDMDWVADEVAEILNSA